jgi:sugar phosphate isomerase/epimerase
VKLAFSRPTRALEEQRLLFDRCLSLGYDGLQLKGGQYRPWLDDPGRFREEWGDAPGLAAGLITAGRPDAKGAESLREVFRFGRAVESALVVYCISGPREGMADTDIAALARTLSGLGREARDLGLRLSVHNHYDSPVMHRKDFDVFFDAADTDLLGLTLDTAHAVKSGVEDVAGVVRDFRGVIDNFHLKDIAGGAWRVLGEGTIDFGPVFAAMRETGYDGWVSTDEESGGEIEATTKRCLAFMRRGLGTGGGDA